MIKIVSDMRNSTININSLNVGDTFILSENLFIMSDEVNLGALNLSYGGEYEEFDAETAVIPVDVEIKVMRKEHIEF